MILFRLIITFFDVSESFLGKFLNEKTVPINVKTALIRRLPLVGPQMRLVEAGLYKQEFRENLLKRGSIFCPQPYLSRDGNQSDLTIVHLKETQMKTLRY